MKNPKKFLSFSAIMFSMLALILDSKTSMKGATEGIDLCIRTVIPALFPFFILSSYFVSDIHSIPVLRPLSKLLHMPKGSEVYLAMGFLGGYPVGAKSIAQGFQKGTIDRDNAERMLAFCSNAGPSFIFGIGFVIFQSTRICIILWLVHMLSAFLVGFMTPKIDYQPTVAHESNQELLVHKMKNAIISMSIVCAWVVAMRVVISFLDRWFLWLLPENWQVVLIGVIELTNGVLFLQKLDSLCLQFMLFSFFLSFGGICVWLQTMSVLSDSGLAGNQYLQGKITQAAVSFLLSIPILPSLRSTSWMPSRAVVLLSLSIIFFYYLKSRNFRFMGSNFLHVPV